MEQKPSSNTPPIRMIPPQPRMNYYIGPRGLIFVLLGLLVIFFGGIGYIEYDRLVKPYLPVFICCIPAVILACLLIFFGIASKFTTIRQIKIQKPRQSPPPDDNIIDLTQPGAEFDQAGTKNRTGQHSTFESPRSNSSHGTRIGQHGGMRKFEPERTSSEELHAKKQNLNQFLKNLDEQHDDGLLMDNVYFNLKTKYRHELNDVNSRLRSTGEKKAKKTKLKKKG